MKKDKPVILEGQVVDNEISYKASYFDLINKESYRPIQDALGKLESRKVRVTIEDLGYSPEKEA